MITLGVCGGSGSGKSQLASFLQRELGGQAVVVCQDWYYRDCGHLSPEQCEQVNFDHPDSIETPLFLRDVDRLLRGETIDAPRYDYATHRRSSEARPVSPAPLLILEGLFVLHEPEVRRRLDLSVYIDVPDDIRLLRRVRRDCQERRVDVGETLRLYEFCVRPMQARYIAPSAAYASTVWNQLETEAEFPLRLLTSLRRRLQRPAYDRVPVSVS